MTTAEKNEIISKFMGDDSPKEHWVYSGEMQYHSDWNWLMGCVEKIQLIPSYDKDKFGTIVKIEGRNYSIKSDNYGDKNKNYSKSLYFNANYSGPTKIEAVHEAVYQFVVWHNQQVKETPNP